MTGIIKITLETCKAYRKAQITKHFAMQTLFALYGEASTTFDKEMIQRAITEVTGINVVEVVYAGTLEE